MLCRALADVNLGPQRAAGLVWLLWLHSHSYHSNARKTAVCRGPRYQL